jgi:hypothetical protein
VQGDERNIPPMTKRMAATFLWYAMVWVGYEIAWSVAGVPRIFGPILAASVAVFVTVDPFQRFWPRPDVHDPSPVEAGSRALDGGVANSN